MDTEKPFPTVLASKPLCDLVKQWDQCEGQLKTSRYAGADGYLYENVTPISAPPFWVRVGRLPLTNKITHHPAGGGRSVSQVNYYPILRRTCWLSTPWLCPLVRSTDRTRWESCSRNTVGRRMRVSLPPGAIRLLCQGGIPRHGEAVYTAAPLASQRRTNSMGLEAAACSSTFIPPFITSVDIRPFSTRRREFGGSVVGWGDQQRRATRLRASISA